MKNLDLDRYNFSDLIETFLYGDYMREQPQNMQNLWNAATLGQINALSCYFHEIEPVFEEFLDSAANQIALQEGEEWAAEHPLEEVTDAIRARLQADSATDEQTARPQDKPRFNVYAGYYELYLTTSALPRPYMWQAVFDDIETALLYMEYCEPEAKIYCESVRNLLPEWMQAIERDNEEEGDAFTYHDDHSFAVNLFMHHCRTTTDSFVIREKLDYALKIQAITQADFDYIMEHYDYFMTEAHNDRAAA